MPTDAKLEVDGSTIELPIVRGTEDEKGIDISKLRAKTGHVTLDNGYVNTGSCKSSITFLNGEKGILRYRGFPIEQLAEHGNFEEVARLLWDGELPGPELLQRFRASVGANQKIVVPLQSLIESFPEKAHPMGVLASSVSAMAAFYPEFLSQDLSSEEKESVFALMMGSIPCQAAAFHHKGQGTSFPSPSEDKDLVSNFLGMMFPDSEKSSDETIKKALDVLFILHADHEQNCSTSTVRLVGSSKANLFASISAGIQALWGPLHGGANQAVLEMLEGIQEAGGDPKTFLDKAKDKKDSFRLMGFGHRVYKNFDPRAKIIKKACDDVLTTLGIQDPLLDIAKGLEEQALKDDYFVQRKLYPNVDFYSGIIYRALGIPTSMFTVMFALGRLPGWLGQWKEMVESPEMKIGRPRQIYTGANERNYVPLDQR